MNWQNNMIIKCFSIIVENRHKGINEHGVPEDKIQIMKDRFEINL